MLAAGIDVTSTVNVQHLESLNDVVFELTGVRVRETFPDRVLDEADQVVLVDLTPEELQLRLQAGKVYPGRDVERGAHELLPAREPRRAARARAARGGRGRRAATPSDRSSIRRGQRRSPSACSPSSPRRSGPSACCAARGARGSGSAPEWTCSGYGGRAMKLNEEQQIPARRAPAARGRSRGPFPRGGVRRLGDGRPRRSPPTAARPTSSSAHPRRGGERRSCAARSSCASSASCRGSTSASSRIRRVARSYAADSASASADDVARVRARRGGRPRWTAPARVR